MNHCCYIIYSPSLNSFYVGETSDFNRRLIQHNQKFFSSAYTSRAMDWEEFIVIYCENITHARRLEAFIKKMKSRKFIESLKNDPDKLVSIVTKTRL